MFRAWIDRLALTDPGIPQVVVVDLDQDLDQDGLPDIVARSGTIDPWPDDELFDLAEEALTSMGFVVADLPDGPSRWETIGPGPWGVLCERVSRP